MTALYGGMVPEMTLAHRSVLTVAILASFVAFLDGSIVNVALPAVVDELGGGITTQQWVLDAYLLTLGSFILLAGSLSDSFGRLHILRLGLVVFGIASVACALAPTSGALIAARAVQGAGAAFLVPSSLALITTTYSGDDQGKAIGTWTAWTGTAFILGPLLGGVFVDTIGWRFIFGINVLPIAVTLVLATRLPQFPGARAPIDVVGAVLGAVGLAGSVFALVEQERLGWDSPLVVVTLGVGLVSLVAFVWWERRTPHPMMPPSLFGHRNFAIGNLTTAFIYAGVALGLLVVVLYFQEVLGLSATLAGLATLPVAALSLFLARTFGALAGRYGPRLFMAVGPVIAASGFLLLLRVDEPFDFWWQAFPGLTVYGLGLAMTVAPLTTAVLGSIPASQAGIGSAVNNAIARVAGLASIALVGTIVGGTLDTNGFRLVSIVTATLFATGGLISVLGIRNAAVKASEIPPHAAANCNDRLVAASSR